MRRFMQIGLYIAFAAVLVWFATTILGLLHRAGVF